MADAKMRKIRQIESVCREDHKKVVGAQKEYWTRLSTYRLRQKNLEHILTLIEDVKKTYPLLTEEDHGCISREAEGQAGGAVSRRQDRDQDEANQASKRPHLIEADSGPTASVPETGGNSGSAGAP